MESIDHDRIVKRYWDLWEQVQSAPEYARLRSELASMEPRYEAILSALPERDRAALDRYITLRESMGRRLIEWVCESFACRADGTAPADQPG